MFYGNIRCLGLVMSAILLFPSPGWSVAWPTDWQQQCVESPFGPRCHVTSHHFHAGWDLLYNSSSARSIAAGEVYLVTKTAPFSGYDWTVIIKHADGSYSGYHHFLLEPTLAARQQVAEGQTLGYNLDGHLHFNYWPGPEFPGPENTYAPGRVLGDMGSVTLTVSGNSDICAMAVYTEGDIRRVGAARWDNPYGEPHTVYLWDYEGDVRSSYLYSSLPPPVGQEDHCWYEYFGPGDACGIAPPNIWNCGEYRYVYFAFPWLTGEWVVDNPNYTFVETGAGVKYTIERPVATLFSGLTIVDSGTTIMLSWYMNYDDVGGRDEFGDKFRVFVERSCYSHNFVEIGSPIMTTNSKFEFHDPEPCGNTCYRVVCERNSDEVRVVEQIVCGSNRPGVDHGVLASPNPTNGGTEIVFPSGVFSGALYIAVFDIRGREVVRLPRKEDGVDSVFWNLADKRGQRVPSGVYSALAISGDRVLGRGKITVLK
jgi:hypothetical protein